jgi:hypothetical protein
VIRLAKEVVRQFVIECAPQYTELLIELQDKGSWLRLPELLITVRDNLNIQNYVELYNDEQRILVYLFLGFLGRDGLTQFSAELAAMSHEEQGELVNELVREVQGLDLDTFWPDTEEARLAAKEEFDRLPEEQKAEVVKRCQFFWSFVLAHFHNTLSLMIHGAKLTELVPQALAGDQKAFCKAVQIDRSLTTHHPFFRSRRAQALERAEFSFINNIAYREKNPTYRGKISYPGVYMVFACLEAALWLDDVTHEEILEICDEAGLHRYQKRIDDVNYITKRLRDYRRMQRRGGLSMQ